MLLGERCGWQPSEIDALYYDEVVAFCDLTTKNQRDEYRMLLDVVTASQSGKGYKEMRQNLQAHKARAMTPTTEAEVLERMRGKKNGI